MDHIEQVYQKLTNVDIQQQQALWNERGKGYYGEFLVFRELYPHLPGNCKILMNIHIPVSPNKTTEIDLLLLHETGAYVFEMKHYKGTIYGKTQEPRWTQYFRTAANHAFRNPIEQNRYHIRALQNRYPDLPIHSFVVFTNPDCDLKVECDESDITVCRLSMLSNHISALTTRPNVMGMDQLDRMFQDLMQFSPTMRQPVTVDAAPIPFHEYVRAMAYEYKDALAKQDDTYHQSVERIMKHYDEKAKKAENECQLEIRHAKTRSRTAIVVASIVCAASIVLSFLTCKVHQTICNKQVSDTQAELARFAQKFEHVGEFESGDITMSKDFITVKNVQLSPSSEMERAVVFGFSLNCNGQYYSASIDRDTTLTVMLKDGTLKEYTLPDDYFPYEFSKELLLGQGNAYYHAYDTVDFPLHHITDIEIEDIDYIKLSPLDICMIKGGKVDTIFSGYEVEIYDCTAQEG